jgi:hypothetical protein
MRRFLPEKKRVQNDVGHLYGYEGQQQMKAPASVNAGKGMETAATDLTRSLFDLVG